MSGQSASKRAHFLIAVIVVVGLVIVPAVGATPGGGGVSVYNYVETESNNWLDGAVDVAVSPDGNHVYVANNVDDSVSVFSRDSTTGRLTFVEAEIDGVGGVDGLNKATSVVVSPDGKHVYVTGGDDNALVVFTRNSTTGMITYYDHYVNGTFMTDPRSVAISPDGNDVYVGSCDDDTVLWWNRNSTTGALTLGGTYSPSGLMCVWDVAATNFNVYATGLNSNNVAAFDRNSTSGALTYLETETDGVGGVNGLDGARHVAVGGGRVYVAGSDDDGVAVFDIDPVDGSLDYVTWRQNDPSGLNGLDGAWGVTVSPDGNHIYAVSFNDHAVVTMQFITLWGSHSLVNKYRLFDNSGGVDGLAAACDVVVSPDGNHVYVASVGDDGVAVFRRDSTTGELTFVEAKLYTTGLDAASGVAVSPDGNNVYVTGWTDNALAIFDRHGGGEVTFVDTLDTSIPGLDGLTGPTSVAVSPDGAHVYVTSNIVDSVAVFTRTAATGELTWPAVYQDGVGGVNFLEGASEVAISSGGVRVYVASDVDNSLTVFFRDTNNGHLTRWSDHYSGDGEVSGMEGANAVAVSPDGSNVYVASDVSDAVAVFDWGVVVTRADFVIPKLFFVEAEADGYSGVDGLNGATSVAVSPDGAHVYVAGSVDDAVAYFSRNSTTGALDYLGNVQDGDWDSGTGQVVDGLLGASSVAVSPDGTYVLVAGYEDDGVAIFSRNRTTGGLSYIGMVKDGVNGVDGMGGPFAITFSPGGANLYVASNDDDSLVVFGHFVAYLPIVMKN